MKEKALQKTTEKVSFVVFVRNGCCHGAAHSFGDFPQDVLDVIEEEVLSESEEVRRCGVVEVWWG